MRDSIIKYKNYEHSCYFPEKPSNVEMLLKGLCRIMFHFDPELNICYMLLVCFLYISARIVQINQIRMPEIFVKYDVSFELNKESKC